MLPTNLADFGDLPSAMKFAFLFFSKMSLWVSSEFGTGDGQNMRVGPTGTDR